MVIIRVSNLHLNIVRIQSHLCIPFWALAYHLYPIQGNNLKSISLGMLKAIKFFFSPNKFLDILALIDEGAILALVHLQSKEKVQFFHHTHFIFHALEFWQLFTQGFVSSPKQHIINMYINKKKKISPLVLINKFLSICPLLDSFFEKEFA